MEVSSHRLDQLLSPFLLFSLLWRMEEGLEIPSFQPWLGLSGDWSPSGSHPGGQPALLKQKKKKKDVPGVLITLEVIRGLDLWSTLVRLGSLAADKAFPRAHEHIWHFSVHPPSTPPPKGPPS